MLDVVIPAIFANLWWALISVSAMMLAATELGQQLGLRVHREKNLSRKEHIGSSHGGILGLLGLLLGFTFSMAMTRYDARRNLVLQEANAIGTTYLRTSFLPEPQRAQVRQLLKEYLDIRVEFYHAKENSAALDLVEKKAASLQREIWSLAVAASPQMMTATISLFFESLNEAIDLDASRLHALRTHVPSAVLLLVLIVASVGCCISGFGAGASGARSLFPNWLLPLLVAVFITMTADLDQPRHGLIDIDQRPMTDLQKSLRNTDP